MKYLLDTDTCVFWLRGRASVRERLSAVGLEEVGTNNAKHFERIPNLSLENWA